MDIVYKILESGVSVDPFIQISRKFIDNNVNNSIPNSDHVIETTNDDNIPNINDINVSDISLVVSETENNINNENNNTTSINIINDFLSKLFWVGYFGSNSDSIKWDLFSTAFMSSYGYQNLHAMIRLKQCLCFNSESNSSDSDNVSIITYATFCNNSNGLLHAFQKGIYSYYYNTLIVYLTINCSSL
jgi:hypothetical protein